MSRRKKGSPVHGWVVLDKPQGVTSTQAVAAVRRLFDAQKAGHAGTLDPMATGVLAIALGEATKTVPFAMDGEKTYRFTARWGEARDSDDAEGEVTATIATYAPSREEIEAALPASPGPSSRPRPPIRRSRSRASGPTIWPARARRVTLDPRRCRSSRPGCWRCRIPTMPCSKSVAAKALMSGPGCAIWPGAGHVGPCFGAAPDPGRRLFAPRTRLGWKRSRLLGIVPPLLSI